LLFRIAAVLAATLTMAGAAIFFAFGSSKEVASAPSPAELAQGQSVYAKNCASCHGAEGQGQVGWQTNNRAAPPHDATGHTWRHPERSLFRFIKTGVLDDICMIDAGATMPTFKDQLSDDQIRAVLGYIASRWPPQIKALNDAINVEYERQDGLSKGG
jgi:S-disulfanyl-L-cysteine oxidoreductase SoxD